MPIYEQKSSDADSLIIYLRSPGLYVMNLQFEHMQ